MRGDPTVIEHLNIAPRNELTAINQYFLHSRMLRSWGVTELAQKEYTESLEEMRHADWLIERVLFLDGLPNLQDIGKLMIGEDVEEILACDLKLEHIALPALKQGIAYCESVQDYGSRDILMNILKNEEEHVDWLEAQLELIQRTGLQNYVQLQSRPQAG